MSKRCASRILPSSPETTYYLALTVVMAFVTLFFQRRDQHRAALREVDTPADVTGDNHKSVETTGLKMAEMAETKISLA